MFLLLSIRFYLLPLGVSIQVCVCVYVHLYSKILFISSKFLLARCCKCSDDLTLRLRRNTVYTCNTLVQTLTHTQIVFFKLLIHMFMSTDFALVSFLFEDYSKNLAKFTKPSPIRNFVLLFLVFFFKFYFNHYMKCRVFFICLHNLY